MLRALEGLRKLYGLDKPVVNKHEIGVAYPVSLKITKVYMVDGTERTRGRYYHRGLRSSMSRPRSLS